MPEHSTHHPPGFRSRRGLNWACIGLLYTSFYMCRYNFSIANGAISEEFGFSKADMGAIITTALLAYACGQIVNGLLADRLGGKHAMLIGAAGTVVMNVIFGVASFWGLLWMFVTIRGIDGYLQAFGAPGMVKINAAWFGQRERGRFAGIFGFMINLGRFGIFKLGPALLAGFVFLGLWQIPPLHWRWLFWVPAGITTVVAICMALIVKDTPEEAGFLSPNPQENGGDARLGFKAVLCTIASNPVVWVVACAYACTGAVRQGIDQWFPRFMSEAYHVDFQSAQFQLVGFLIPFVASAGSLVSGYVSDTLFRGRRRSGRSRSLFYRDRHYFAGGTIPHRERRRRFFSPHFIHGKCDPLHPWNRGRDGYWRCENGRIRDWRDRLVSVFRRKSGRLLPWRAARQRLGRLLLFHGAVWRRGRDVDALDSRSGDAGKTKLVIASTRRYFLPLISSLR